MWQTPPPSTEMATAADGTHPTGMHSWFIMLPFQLCFYSLGKKLCVAAVNNVSGIHQEFAHNVMNLVVGWLVVEMALKELEHLI